MNYKSTQQLDLLNGLKEVSEFINLQQKKEAPEGDRGVSAGQIGSENKVNQYLQQNEHQENQDCKKQANPSSIRVPSKLLFPLVRLFHEGTLKDKFLVKMCPLITMMYISIDREGLLREEERQIVHECIDFCSKPQTQPSFIRQVKQQDHQENYRRQFLLNQGQRHNQQLINLQQSKKVQTDRLKGQKMSLSLAVHSKFWYFFDQSMKKLKIYDQIRSVCLAKQAWPRGGSINNFLKKVIAIKMIFPKYFPTIIVHYMEMIDEFNRVENPTEIERIAIRQISPLYLNCVMKYVQSDDILAAANQLYKNSGNNNKAAAVIPSFENYQRLMQQKANDLRLKNIGLDRQIEKVQLQLQAKQPMYSKARSRVLLKKLKKKKQVLMQTYEISDIKPQKKHPQILTNLNQRKQNKIKNVYKKNRVNKLLIQIKWKLIGLGPHKLISKLLIDDKPNGYLLSLHFYQCLKDHVSGLKMFTQLQQI